MAKNLFICFSLVVPISYIADTPSLRYNTARMKKPGLKLVVIASHHYFVFTSRNFERTEALSTAKGDTIMGGNKG